MSDTTYILDQVSAIQWYVSNGTSHWWYRGVLRELSAEYQTPRLPLLNY
jgi:hypothetical protein